MTLATKSAATAAAAVAAGAVVVVAAARLTYLWDILGEGIAVRWIGGWATLAEGRVPLPSTTNDIPTGWKRERGKKLYRTKIEHSLRSRGCTDFLIPGALCLWDAIEEPLCHCIFGASRLLLAGISVNNSMVT